MRRNNRRFAIYSPVLGLNENTPGILLNKQALTDMDGVRIYKERLIKMPLRTAEFKSSGVKVQTTDGFPVMEIASTVDIDGNVTTLVFTKRHIYTYTSGAYTDITPLDDGETPASLITSDVEYWSVTDYNGTLVFTNGLAGNIFIYSQSSGTVQQLDTRFDSESTGDNNTIVSAKFCWTYKNYLFLGGIIYYNDSVLTEGPNLIVNSNIGEGIDVGGFYQDVGKDSGFYAVEGSGIISGVGVMGSQFAVFKTSSSKRYWFTGGVIPFNSESLYEIIGCQAPGSIVSGRTRDSLYFYGSDGNFYEVSRGPIGTAIKGIEDSINPNALLQIKAAYIRDFQEIYWSVPIGDSATNNLVVTYKDDGRWGKARIPVSCFSEYKRSVSGGYTWNVNPYTTWDNIPSNIAWNSSAITESFITPICGSYDGYVYNINDSITDDGDDYESWFTISTDLMDKASLMFPKRISQIWAYFENTGNASAVLKLEYKCNQEQNWRSAGRFSVDTGTNNSVIRSRIPVDIRGNNFLFKVSTVDDFSCIGFEFEYTINGGGR